MGTKPRKATTPGSAPPRLGIGVTDPSQVTTTVNRLTGPPDMRPQVQGLGGNPTASPPVASVAQINPIPQNLTTQALQALVIQLSASPDQVLTSGTFTGNLMKPGGAPQVTVVDLTAGGEATLAGTGVGKGILIVKGGAAGGELKLRDTFQFQGLIITCCSTGTAELEMEIDDTAKVFGGMVMFSQSAIGKSELEMEKTGQLARSTQGMAFARQLIPGGRGTVWSWREL